MNLSEYILSFQKRDNPDIANDRNLNHADRIECADGFNLSVQANWGAYCTPRTNNGPWSEVEVGFPSAKPDLIMKYAETPETPEDTVYGYVPIELVEQLIAEHGGQKS